MQFSVVPLVLNIVLTVLFPLSWVAPLLHTGLLESWQMPGWLGGGTLFAPDTITVLSGLQKLWATDLFLALVVTVFALVAPMLKCLGMALIQTGLLSRRMLPALGVLAKLAMADIFLIALYVVIAKGIGIGVIIPGWGLYVFTGAVLGSFAVSFLESRQQKPPRHPADPTA
ncbi:paraquat-inducible protein A [Cognatishimia sp. F0-27]|uniref:paraquat-inducible protein A n=1 Tax=Cognatishimia sp. F0-27 TaxID=2816855 RepID=UPI001D0C43E9|nr:paraquat-inducible protein A [Cognatishimia sp. F0-27]MCC1493256.1 paraquat-inducible protein A [Cognatishimia sp. F0-27]